MAAVGVCTELGSIANLKEAIVSTEREPGSASSRLQGQSCPIVYTAALAPDPSLLALRL